MNNIVPAPGPEPVRTTRDQVTRACSRRARVLPGQAAVPFPGQDELRPAVLAVRYAVRPPAHPGIVRVLAGQAVIRRLPEHERHAGPGAGSRESRARAGRPAPGTPTARGPPPARPPATAACPAGPGPGPGPVRPPSRRR